MSTQIQRNATGQTTGASADVAPGQASASVRDGQASVGINEQGLVHCQWTFDSQDPAASEWSGASVNLAMNAVPVKHLPDSKEEIQQAVVSTTHIPAAAALAP